MASWAYPDGPLPPGGAVGADGRSAGDRAASQSLPRFGFSKERLRLRLYITLLALDLAAIAGAFLLAGLIRFGNPLEPAATRFILAFGPLYAALAFSGKAYSIKVLEQPRQGIFAAVRALCLTACVLLVILFYMKTTGDVSRAAFGLGTLGAIGAITLSRHSFGRAVGERYDWSFMNEVLLVDRVTVYPGRGQIVCFAQAAGLAPDINDPDSYGRIGELLAKCDRVVLACPPESRIAWARTLKGAGTNVEVLTPELDYLGAMQLRHVGGRAAVLVACGPLALRDRILKRGLDLAITLPALLFLAPVLLAIALAIRLDSKGPVFFRQARVGQGNRTFQMLKFRTMRLEASDAGGTRSASRDDDRVTRLGRFLRRTSLDELPQLLNVLAGDMSIVGPRPHALASTAESALFWQIDHRYWERGAVKPGITGLAQVRGHRGATLVRADLTNRLQADLEYLAGWSLWRDIGIILRTARVLVHPNAF
jgi:lipopolysaccharide/colanic/teichoic acid biosynthesis glycosyltransferase